MPSILLTTLNARYIHASLGLRYIFANMGELQPNTQLVEFTINDNLQEIAEGLLALQPRIIGIGVYIWNLPEVIELTSILKSIAPEIRIVVGGPEVSYECEQHPILPHIDHLLPGNADLAFAKLCRKILRGESALIGKLLIAEDPPLDQLVLPYLFYSDEDVRHRVLYVEASRGCPYKCEFCLSSLDKTSVAFDLTLFLEQIDQLYQRGARQFKFVDRTFNLKAQTCKRILEFFLDKNDPSLFLHFEMVPDRLPEEIKLLLPRFPAGAIQLEIGIQTFNPEVQQQIQRKQDSGKTLENLRWLTQNTQAHLHTDLIIGLPGENLESIADGFNQLVALRPDEIQVGILKRLRGAPINRHTSLHQMVYKLTPPYNLLRNQQLDFQQMQALTRFARYWDLIGNSGHFPNALPILLGSHPFQRFYAFSYWLHASTGQTHQIALKRLFYLLYQGLIEASLENKEQVVSALKLDYERSPLKGFFDTARAEQYFVDKSVTPDSEVSRMDKRQKRHIEVATGH